MPLMSSRDVVGPSIERKALPVWLKARIGWPALTTIKPGVQITAVHHDIESGKRPQRAWRLMGCQGMQRRIGLQGVTAWAWAVLPARTYCAQLLATAQRSSKVSNLPS